MTNRCKGKEFSAFIRQHVMLSTFGRSAISQFYCTPSSCTFWLNAKSISTLDGSQGEETICWLSAVSNQYNDKILIMKTGFPNICDTKYLRLSLEKNGLTLTLRHSL
jgi:hypothetical protein